MMDDLSKIRRFGEQGFYCSQVILLMGLEWQGKEDPALVRSMHALAGGIGFSGHNCGALIGGACLLGYFAGRGSTSEEEDDRLFLMLNELVDWFTRKYGVEYGGIDCENILSGGKDQYVARCPGIVQSTLQKCKELLVEYGYELNGE